MPGRFVNFVRRNNGLIDEVLGNVDDIRVKKNLKEALGELNQFKEERDNYKKFIKYADAVSNVDIKLSDHYKKVPGFLFNEGIENTDEYKAYVDKLVKDTEALTGTQGTADNKGTQNVETPVTEPPKIQVTEEGLRQFILENPQYYKSLYEKGSIMDKTEPKTQEELYDEIYKKAGLTDPNERQWFETYKKSFDAEGYNNSLSRFIAGQYPNLTSRGNLKDTYYKQFGNIASTYGITPQKFADTEDPLAKANPKDWTAEQVDGRWYWVADVYNKKTRQWEKQQVKQMTAEEVKNKGVTGDNLKKMSGDELGRLTYEQLMSKFNPEDVADNLMYLNADAKSKFLAKYPELAAEIEESNLKGTKKKSSGRKRSSGTKKYTQMEKFAKSSISRLSEIGLKYSAIPFDKWSDTPQGEKDKAEYQQLAAALQKQFSLSGDDVHRIVGEFEKTGKVNIDTDNTETDTEEEYTDNYDYMDDVFNNDKLTTAELTAILKQITNENIPEEEKNYARRKYLEKVTPDDEAIPYNFSKKRKK